MLGVAALATLGIIFATSHDSGPEYHRDGLGPLGSVGDPASDQAIGFDPLVGGPTWSVGVQLCLAQGDQSAVLDGSVTSTKSVSGGIKDAVFESPGNLQDGAGGSSDKVDKLTLHPSVPMRASSAC